jgi:TRAP-type uncharacterized transport system fused permease subunit
MGVPVTAAYLITSVIVVTVLTNMGVPLLAVYKIIYLLSKDSNNFLPVCIAAFIGATIAKADPFCICSGVHFKWFNLKNNYCFYYNCYWSFFLFILSKFCLVAKKKTV